MPNNKLFRSDDYVFVGKSFNFSIDDRLKSKALLRVLGEVDTNSVDYELTGMGGFPELPEYTGDLNYINPKRGFKAIIRPSEKLGAYDVHYKAYKNDRLGELKKCGSQLAEAAGVTVYLDALRLFGNAFTVSGGDGKTWAATDHPNAAKYDEGRTYVADADAGTGSNLLTEEFSVKGIDNARVHSSYFVTPAGMPYLGEYDLLLISPELEPTARKLLGDKAMRMPTKDPESAENAASSIYGLEYLVVGAGAGKGKLGLSGKQWALCDSKRMKETALIVYNSRPQTREGNPVNPWVKTYTAYADYALGYGDWRPIIFSNPG